MESTNKLTNRIEERCGSEKTKPRMGFPSLRLWGGASAFQSQRLKVGGSGARWAFVVTLILDSSQNPDAPSANTPSVVGSELGVLRDADDSASSGPLVAPAMIDLPGMVS
jgi:hypothetical protein